MTAATTDQLLARLVAVAGTEHVKILENDARYGALLSPALTPSERPRAVVKPANTEELQAVLKTVRELDHALWVTPNATGNGARTGRRDRPAVLADLSRMNRVLELDSASAYALVEPGVSFTQLAQHIADAKLPFWIDCDKNGAHSVAGSIGQRAFGYTPYSDHLLMQCGFEVLLADGTLMRTGMGALPDNNTWQLFKYNYGPYLDGLFSRADFGIVIKTGLWIMPAPPAWHPFLVSLPNDMALGAAIDLLRPFKIDMSLPGSVTISSQASDLALVGHHHASEVSALQAVSGTWNLCGAVVGLPANVEFVWSLLGPALSALPGATVFTARDGRTDALWQTRTQLTRGVPAYHADATANDSLWFVASAPIEGGEAAAMHEIVTQSLHAIDHQCEFALGWRTLFMRIEVAYDAATYPSRRESALTAIAALTKAGYAITHDSADLTSAVATTHTGPGLQHLYAGLREAFDPVGTFG
ncbi:MAG: FAD-binding oxidoreductase [Gammaproteobacteria bacterium]|nr:FAD-binding oxidoreductase [Gammaproteobacteria bacterium]